jgi:hypothetical protein
MTAPHTTAAREWVGYVRISVGSYCRTGRVRVRASAPDVAIQRALLSRKESIRLLSRHRIGISGIWIFLRRVPQPRKGVRRETAV